MKRYVWYLSVSGIDAFKSKIFPSTVIGKFVVRKRPSLATSKKKGVILNLKRGDIVEVRSAKEIFDTLDSNGKLNGCSFTREMMKFCGKRFVVYKRLKKIIFEDTGELRTMKNPTVFLEGVFCDGSAHAGCDRSCFCFWREQWLKRVPTTDHSGSGMTSTKTK